MEQTPNTRWFNRGRFRRGPPLSPSPPPPPAPVVQPLPDLPPVHLKSTTPLSQQDSALFKLIPGEIRSQIFDYYFTETSSSLYPKDTVYTRPGYSAKRKVDTALLQTCRRIYLETCFLPPKTREHVFWHSPERSPSPNASHGPFGIDAEKEYFSQMPTWQWAEVKSVHLFTQLFWLERGDCLGQLLKQEPMANVERLKITIRKSDWWWNERDEALSINPYTGDGQHYYVLEDILTRINNGEKVEFAEGSWARFFAHLPKLEELIFELESLDHKTTQLERIVTLAKGWEFPMGERGYLKAEENVESRDWRGGMSNWDERRCCYCESWGGDECREVDGKRDRRCDERKGLRQMGLGPMLVVREVKWCLVKPANFACSS